MNKSEIIANCLVNSGFFQSIEDAKLAIYKIFQDSYPDQSFNSWNAYIDESIAHHIIDTVGEASHINVARLIKDLW